MIPYIPHVALLIGICLIFYKIFLEKETFFKLNRYLLLACVVISFIIPTLEIPESWSIWESTPELSFLPNKIVPQEELASSNNLGQVAAQDLTVIASQPEISQEATTKASPAVASKPKLISSINWSMTIWYIYLIGLGIFGINLLIQLLTLLVQIIRLPSLKDGKYRIVEMEKDKAPYSFMNCIFINPTKYDWDTYNQILDHEKIHVRQLHSIDMILAEILVVLQWFNPLAWQYRKTIENNLEYLTDNAMLHKGADREPYQLNLLKVSVPQYPVGLAMNYNQSILKKRIKMMNAKKSSVRTSWKYLAIVPLLGLTILCFNAVKVAAKQQKTEDRFQSMEQVQNTIEGAVLGQIGTTTDNIVHNSISDAISLAGEIAAQVNAQLEGPIQENSFIISGELPLEMKGIWQAEIMGDKVCVRFNNSDFQRNSHWISSECFAKSDFSSLPTTEQEFTIKRDAGTVTFKGKFEDGEGMGRYNFVQDPSFASYLKSQGIKGEAKEETMFHFFLSNIDKSYVSDLKQEGYTGLDMKELKKLAIHGVSREYIREMAAAGYKDLSLEDLVKGKIHDIEPEYIKELSSAGFSNLDFDDLVRFAIHDVDADFVQELADAGFKDLSAEQIVKASIHDVDVDYIKDLKSVGYDLNNLEEIIRFSIHDVDADFVKALKEAGFSNLSADKITKAAIHDVDPNYIAELAEIGYDMDNIEDIITFAIHDVDAALVNALKSVGFGNLSPQEITSAAIHDVNPQYIKDLKSAGFDMSNIEDVISFKIHDVDIAFIEALEKAGYKNLSPNEIRNAAIHDVDARYINELKASGIELPTIEDITRFAIHDVSVRYIKELRTHGYNDLSAEDIVKAKIHDVDPSDIKEYKDLGFKDISLEQVIRLKIHDVTPRFIKSAREKGYKDLTLEQYRKIKIHGIYED